MSVPSVTDLNKLKEQYVRINSGGTLIRKFPKLIKGKAAVKAYKRMRVKALKLNQKRNENAKASQR